MKRLEPVKHTPAERAALDAAAGASPESLRRRRQRLNQRCPSMAVADAVWHNGEKLPAGYVRCIRCNTLTPPIAAVQTNAGYVCEDCRLAAAYGGGLLPDDLPASRPPSPTALPDAPE